MAFFSPFSEKNFSLVREFFFSNEGAKFSELDSNFPQYV